MDQQTIGFALCGSFCTFRKTIDALRPLAEQYHIIPILSEAAYETDSRFGPAADFRREIEDICQERIRHTLPDVEPFGPRATLDLLVVAPCTGNTLGKLANGIADSPVTFACKAHLRNARPAATSSCVDRGLQPVACTSAPPAARQSARKAVLASIWMEMVIFFPAKGFSFSKRARMATSAGMKSCTHSIFILPEAASDISFTWLMAMLPSVSPVIIAYSREKFKVYL